MTGLPHLRGHVRPLLVLLALGVTSSTCLLAKENLRPNFVIFITDDQSEEDYGCLGGKTLTPRVDQLAREGMIFTNAHVSSSVCSPSRYSVLTGRYAGNCRGKFFTRLHPPHTMTRVENNCELEMDRSNFARLLQRAGYRTGFAGKCHVVDHHLLDADRKSWQAAGLQTYDSAADPRRADVSAKLRHNHDVWCRRLKDFGFAWAGGLYAANLRELHNEHAQVHNLEWTVDAACRFMRQSRDKPFFLYVATTVPHGPAPWIQKRGKLVHSLDADPRMSGQGYLERAPSVMPRRATVARRVKEAGLDVARQHHATWIDDAVGALLDQLKLLYLSDDTVFVLMSDHGSRRHGKTTLYDNGIKIPMIVRYPRIVAAGERCDALVNNVDLAPTLWELADAGKQDGEQDGISFVPLLRSGEGEHRDDLFAELGYARAIKTKDWKYIAIRYPESVQRRIDAGRTFAGYRGAKIERPYLTRNGHLGHFAAQQNPNYYVVDQLYDLRADPAETTNVSAKHPRVLAQMKRRLAARLRQFGGRPFGEFTKPQSGHDKTKSPQQPSAK